MSLKKLQETIGAKPDGAFGPGTLKAAMVYFETMINNNKNK